MTSNNENSQAEKELLKERLSDMSYYCTQESGTEPPFTGIYTDEKDPKEPINVLSVMKIFSPAPKSMTRAVAGPVFGVLSGRNLWTQK